MFKYFTESIVFPLLYLMRQLRLYSSLDFSWLIAFRLTRTWTFITLRYNHNVNSSSHLLINCSILFFVRLHVWCHSFVRFNFTIATDELHRLVLNIVDQSGSQKSNGWKSMAKNMKHRRKSSDMRHPREKERIDSYWSSMDQTLIVCRNDRT